MDLGAGDKPSTWRFLAGGGEMGALMRAQDWTRTPLGPPDSWPQSLKTAIRIMLASRQPVWIGWGKELTYLYNDPYKAIIGGKHPWALGKPTAAVWREIWPEIGPMLATAMGGEEGTYVEAQLLIMERNGYPEETYYTFSYTPIPDDDGFAGGVICTNTDDTQRVIGERQLALLRELAMGTAEARSREDACERSMRALAANPRDLPFAMLYLAEPGSDRLTLAGACGIAPEQAEAALAGPGSWPFAEVLHRHEARIVSDLETALGADLPTGAWDQPPRQAALLPMTAAGETGRAGILVVGLNPFRLYDESYQRFLGLVAGQVAAAIANAQAYAEERRRAEALAEIDRAKTAFFSNTSHEFRTPLTLMISPLEELLARGAATGRVVAGREEIEVIHRNSLRLLKLVNTLLDFSRIEAGRVQAFYEAVDIAAYTAELASTFRSAMEKAGLRFVVTCPPLGEPAYVDRDMWEKIVLNLVSNAFKYTLEGEVAVTLRRTEDGKGVELAVRDTGVGIPEDELPRIFERFHRIAGQRGRSQEGTGIGLALVQELTRFHGGAVHAESAVGRGTCITVTIPLGRAHLPAGHIGVPAAPTQQAVRAEAFVEEALRWLPGGDGGAVVAERELIAPSHEPDAESRPSRVLVADDNADMRSYMQRLLGARYEVETVADGEAALASARRRRPDLVLSDVMMPRLDGFGLLRALRDDTELRDIPVILLSARAGEEAKAEGLEAGADDYLVKPFGSRELLARVSANLGLARSRRQAMEALQEEARTLETLNRAASILVAELNIERLVQSVTDAAVDLTGAQFGAFFYNLIDDKGESLLLYTLSGARREDFAKFPNPRNTSVFGRTFRGEGIVRSDDILKDPRYGKNPPYYGTPPGHLPVRSYLAVPVRLQSGEVIGGLFFGHAEPAIFTARHELIVAGLAAQAAVAFDKARLHQAMQRNAEELRRLNETLEQRVAAELAERIKLEDAFRQAQKMEAIGQLTGGVAHDFNNLLQVILGNLEALKRRGERGIPAGDAAFRKLAEAATHGAERAAALTHRLLAFSRRQPLAPKPIDVNRLVTGMSELLRRTLGEAIRIETVLAGGMWRIAADANQLESALLNLAVNARDAMPEGGRLTIETANAHLDDTYAAAHEEVRPGQYALIAVTDSGAGMTQEIVARAFDPFFTTKEAGQGTGLGLSQVYGFAKQSGGHVKIYSEPGAGTTVKLYFPRLLGDVGEVERAAEPRIPTGTASEVILVVEDDPDVRAYSTEMLRELGYRVLQAGDGPSALAMLDAEPRIALLFTDVGLPGGLTGRQLADEARRRRPALKVLFTTGYARNAIVHNGTLDPGVELIGKPFTYAALAAKIRRVLERGGGA